MNESRRAGPELAGAAFGTLGIVFGDIGTSPIYAFREAFHDAADMGHFGRRPIRLAWCAVVLQLAGARLLRWQKSPSCCSTAVL